jgi:hypothetical protein
MKPQRILANSNVKADVGRFAIQNGPMVYCLEGVDNKDGMVQSIVMDTSAVLRVHYVHQLLNGVNVISGTAISKKVTAIPYYSWDNRGPGEMEVWIPYIQSVSWPQPASVLTK